MTLLELVTYLRKSILDDVGGTSVDWSSLTEDNVASDQLRWSNEELTRFINEAQNRVCLDALAIKDSTTFSISVTTGIASYSLDSRIIQIKGIYLSSTGKELVEQEYEDLYSRQNWRTVTGTPTHYMIDIDTGKIQLYPKPEADDTINIVAYRLPLTQLDWELSEIQSSELRLEYQIPMLNWAAYLAYQKDEANTFDPQRATYFRQLYSADFTYNSPYSDIRRRRSSNRPIGYGGI